MKFVAEAARLNFPVLPTLSKVIWLDWPKFLALRKNKFLSLVLSTLDQFLNHFRVKICETSSLFIYS
jgi:hypothetical protein